jgi:LPXTG-motif cell wall-anchored protein
MNKKRMLSEREKQRWALRKLTVGLSSVLLGMTFLGVNGTAQAATSKTDSGSAVVTEETTNSGTGDTAKTEAAKTTVAADAGTQTPVQIKLVHQTTQAKSIDGYDGPYSDNTLTTEKKVAEQTVNADTDNQTVTLYYAKKQSNTLTFVDDDDNGAQVGKTITINGHQGKTVNWNAALPENYELADGQTIPSSYEFTQSDPTAVVVHLKHKQVAVDENTTDKDGNHAKLSEEVKRTITANVPDGNGGTTAQDLSQTTTLTRTATKDAVTGEFVYGAWSKGTFAEINAPKVNGYTPSQATIAAQEAVYGYVDPKIEINYTAKDQSISYKFVDDDNNGEQVGTDIVVTGKTDETVDISSQVKTPDNYVLTEGETLPTSYKFKANGNEPVTIHLKHRQDAVDENTTDKDGKHAKLSEEVKRTITANVPDGNGGITAQDLSQTATLTRTATKDAVTGEFVYGEWSKGTFAAVNAPKVDGYTPSQATVATQEAVDGYVDPKIKINYTAKDQSISFKFVDDDNNGSPVGTDIVVNGKTDEIVNPSTSVSVPTNYVLADGQTIPTSYKFKATGNDSVTIHLKHKLVNNEHPAESLTKTVTRTINDQLPTGTKSTTQKVTFTRTAQKDLVTKKDKYSDWQTDKAAWDEYTATVPKGYEAKVDGTAGNVVASQQVTADTKDTTVNITYSAKKETIKVVFVDSENNDKQVTTQEISGKTATQIDLPAVPANYDLASGEAKQITVSGDEDQTVTVKLVHQRAVVSDSSQYSELGVASADQQILTKDVTRTIEYVDENGQELASQPATAQTVSFGRSVIVDKVTKTIIGYVDPTDSTKTITDGDQAWKLTSTSNKWNSATLPAITGYDGPFEDSSLTNAADAPAEQTVQANDSDQTVKIYYAKQFSNTLTFIDNDNGDAQVSVKRITGHKGQTIAWDVDLPTNYELADGQTLPTNYEFVAGTQTPVTVHLVHKTVADPTKNRTKTITRTIVDNKPGQAAVTSTQEVTFVQNATKDLVTGQDSWSDWTTDKNTWDSQSITAPAGYTALVNGTAANEVASQTVTADTQDTTVNIIYQAADQNLTVEYIDNDNHDQVVTSQTFAGKTDQTLDLTGKLTAPDHYDLVDPLPTSYKFTAGSQQVIKINLKHHIQTLDNETASFTRTIVEHQPTGDQSVTQTASFTRTVKLDEVTSDKSYGQWTAASEGSDKWAAYTPTAVAGYTPSTTSVEEMLVDPKTAKNVKVEINYQAKDQSFQVTYIDDDDPAAKLTGPTLSGETDQTIDLTGKLTLPENYEFAAGQPTSYKFKASDNKLEIHLKHKTQKVTDPAETQETFTRTIIDQLPTGSKTTTQVVKFTRTVTKDLVSGATTAGDWTLATDSPAQDWAEYTAQVPAGYSAKINGVAGNTVAKYTINPNDTKLTDSVTITYTANSQTATVIFVDGDKNNEQVGSGQTISGQTDQTVDLPAIPANYATDASQSKTYKFTAEPNQTITITLHHKHEDVTDQSQLTKEVKRTISITKPGETATTQTQTVKFTRTGSKDLVTGETSYTDWKADGTDTWDAVNVPSVDGYSAVIKDGEQTLSEIASQTVTAEMADQTITVTYAANDQTLHISYIDSDDPTKQLTGQDITGTTGQTISLAGKLSLPENYELSADTPSSYTFKASDNSLEVKLVHKRQAITDQSQLTKEIKRIINITEPGKAATTQTQTVKFTRTGSKDLVTGDTSYTDWQADGTDTWAEVSVPTVSGYTPSQATIAAETVDPKTATDQTVTITYTANDQDITVTYVDDDDSTRHPQDETIHGKTGQTINVAEQLKNVPNGYDLADSTISYTVKAEGANTVEVHLKHHLEDLTDETKTFTRTIIEHQPSGDQTKTQTATFKRTAKLDKVTNQTINGAWTAASEGSDKWAEYVPTAVAGYTPSEVQVAEETVDPNTATDQTVEINYTPAEHTIKVKFVDDDAGGAQVGAIATISGKTGATIDLPGTPTNYDLASGQNATYKVTSDSDQTVEVHLTHKHEAINDPSELTKEITRTISITKPGETATTQTQTVKFTRTGSKDLVTERKTYTEWQAEGGKDSWESVTVPTVAGYTPSQTTIAAEKVDPKTATNQTVTITYTANDQTITVKYVDDDAGGAQVGETSTISGKTGTSITLPTYQDNRYESKAGTYEVTGASDQTVEVHLTHKHQSSQSTKNISRTIVLDIPGQTQPETITQTVKFVQNNDTDLVTNQVKQGVWTVSGSDKWDAYTPKAVAGYTPSQNSVAEQTVTSDTPNTTVTITYSQNAKSAKITFVDDDNGGQQIGQPVTINGQAGTSLDLSSDIPTNYQLVSASDNTYVFTTDENQTKTIHLKHKTESVTDSKTVKRTITENIPGKSPKTTDQEVVFTRTGTKDLVTNQTTYGAWDVGTNGGKWAAYTPTAVPGYTPSVSTVSEQTVTPETGNATVTITYTKQSQSVSASVKFIDADNHDASVSGSATIQGTVDEQADLSQLTLPANYELAPGQSYTFTSDQGQTVTLKLKHKLQVQADQTKTVTRTIVEHIPGQTETTRTTQTVTFKRTVATDLVTNQPVYGNWQADGDSQWSSYTITSVNGYDAQIAGQTETIIPATTVTADTADQTIEVTYVKTPIPETVTATVKIIIKNSVDQVINTKAFTTTGRVGDWIEFGENNSEVKNWLTQFMADHPNYILAQVPHASVAPAPQAVMFMAMPVRLNASAPAPKAEESDSGININDLDWNHLFGRYQAGQQTLTFDFVLKEKKSDDHGDHSGQGGQTDTPGEIPSTPTETQQTIVVRLVDDDNQGAQVGQAIAISGLPGQTVKVPLQLPQYYQLAAGQALPSEYTFKTSGNEDLAIHVTHMRQNVYETKTENQNGQQLQLRRDRVEDVVTGEVAWSQWQVVGISSTGDTNSQPGEVPSTAGTIATPNAVNNQQTAKANTEQDKLPQTGNESESAIGIGLAIGASLLGLAGADRRKKHE